MKDKLINIKVSETERDVLRDKAKEKGTKVSKMLLKPHLKDFKKAEKK